MIFQTTPAPQTVDTFRQVSARISESLAYLGPEIALSVTVCALLLLDLFVPREKTKWTGYLALAGTVLAALLVVPLYGTTRPIFPLHDASGAVVGSMMSVDSFGCFFKLVTLVGTAVVVVMSLGYEKFGTRRMGEYYSYIVAGVLGMCFMASATHLLMMFLAIELVSLASYVLVGYLKENREGSEAALKYVIYGSVSAAVMLYGISLLYGLAGTGDIGAVTKLLATSVDSKAIALAFFLVFAGFAYKISAFPMQFWTPDVYEGAPTPVTAYLAVTSKAAGFAIFLRFVAAIGPGRSFTFAAAGGEQAITLDWPLVIGAIAALTMTFGNLAALFQRNVKRLLAYSSIAHAGYALMGVASLRATTSPGAQSVAFYLVVYLFMNLGAFAVVIALDKVLRTEEIDGYRGLARRNPLLAGLMTVFLVALIGLPPTAGFIGKMQLFVSAIDTNLTWLAVIAGVNTAISVYYYARIIKVMYLDESDDATPLGIPSRSLALIVLMAVPVLVLGVFFGGLLEETRSLVLLGFAGR